MLRLTLDSFFGFICGLALLIFAVAVLIALAIPFKPLFYP